MSTPLRLGMIGCGLISHAHGRASLKSGEDIRFVACASRNADRVHTWADAYGCEAHYTDYAQMLREQFLDGVVVATWPADHREHVEAVIDAGIKYVLCEKSLTVSAEDALSIWEAARAAEATIMEGFMYRYHPAMDRFRDAAEGGEIGKIDSMRAVFDMYRPGSREPGEANWRLRADAGGGVAYDFTCYPVDALNMLAGALPVRVTGAGARTDRQGVLTRLCGAIEYANGIIGIVESSHDTGFSQVLELAGSEGRLAMPVAWSIRDEAIIIRSRVAGFLELEQQEIRIPQPQPHDGRLIDFPVFTRQLESFARVIRGAGAAGITLAESVVNAIVLDALVESARSRRAVDCAVPPAIVEALAQRGAR